MPPASRIRTIPAPSTRSQTLPSELGDWTQSESELRLGADWLAGHRGPLRQVSSRYPNHRLDLAMTTAPALPPIYTIAGDRTLPSSAPVAHPTSERIDGSRQPEPVREMALSLPGSHRDKPAKHLDQESVPWSSLHSHNTSTQVRSKRDKSSFAAYVSVSPLSQASSGKLVTKRSRNGSLRHRYGC